MKYACFLAAAAVLLFPFAAVADLDGPPDFVLSFGSRGQGNGKFIYPTGVAVGKSGRVYVADHYSDRIQVFDEDGVFLKKWGTYGSGPGQFRRPWYVATDAAGAVYVTEFLGSRVQKFDADGNYLASFGTGQLVRPCGIAVDAAGNIYVANQGSVEVRKFDAKGKYLMAIGTGLLQEPWGVALNANGDVYVSDAGQNRIVIFDGAGKFLGSWGSYGWVGDTDDDLDGKFCRPEAIAISTEGFVLVADRRNHRIQMFDIGGTFLTKWGVRGDGDGEFGGPSGIAVKTVEEIYVVDRFNDRIQKFGIGSANLPPTVTASGGGRYEYTDSLTLTAKIADPDGDPVDYEWWLGSELFESGDVPSGANKSAWDGVRLDLDTTDLGLGTHVFELIVSDGTAEDVSTFVEVIVVDTKAPSIVMDGVPETLSKPNHEMRDIPFDLEIEDLADPDPWVEIEIVSSEPDDGKGDGSTTGDIALILWSGSISSSADEPAVTWEGALSDLVDEFEALELRAERSGNGPGRTYTITVTATDSAGNSSESTWKVEVPHDKGKGKGK